MIDLLRVAKEYNTNLFGNLNGIAAKIIILLRDDIKATLLDESDAAKIFKSYGIKISWYNDATYKRNVNELPIKIFINRRIKQALETKKMTTADNIRWEGFIESNFKSILDYTFHTPRDLISFFSPITNYDYSIPITLNESAELMSMYCDAVADEVKSMLGIHYEIEEIEAIFDSLRAIALHDFQISVLISALEQRKIQNPYKVPKTLFESSIIGYVEYYGEDKAFMYFKHREKEQEPLVFDPSPNRIMTLHKPLKDYFYNHKNAWE